MTAHFIDEISNSVKVKALPLNRCMKRTEYIAIALFIIAGLAIFMLHLKNVGLSTAGINALAFSSIGLAFVTFLAFEIYKIRHTMKASSMIEKVNWREVVSKMASIYREENGYRTQKFDDNFPDLLIHRTTNKGQVFYNLVFAPNHSVLDEYMESFI